MKKWREIDTALHRLEKTCTTSWTYRQRVITLLRQELSFQAYCLSAVDPHALLSIGAVTEHNIESIHHQIFKNEYLQQDVNHYARLFHEERRAAVLSEQKEEQLKKSYRYTSILKPAVFKDELRAVLVYKNQCFGYLTLFKKEEHFQSEEKKLIENLSSSIGRGLQTFYHLFLEPVPLQPKMLLFSPDLKLISYTKTGIKMLDALRASESLEGDKLPKSIQALCYRTLGSEEGSAHTLLALQKYGFLTLSSFLLIKDKEDFNIAINIAQASPTDILTINKKYYHLSKRESNILDYLIKGSSTKEIANDLFLSPYTVQDHLKSIFLKTGVSTRRELVFKLFTRYTIP
ncbi:helix-turn-helix transcriptional regulator [Priestia endophytica]|uniref:helix-turn-helix transcriptional regulator n=1 Tax=Priestia endophytica TaxID=135735 RepID=UPI003D2B6659